MWVGFIWTVPVAYNKKCKGEMCTNVITKGPNWE